MIQNKHHMCHIDILTTQYYIVMHEECIDMLPYQYVSYIYVTGPAKIDHVSAKKSQIFSVFAVS